MAYKLQYSDYVTSEGPPDPEEWVGPPGPPGPVGPQGEQGIPGEDGIDGGSGVASFNARLGDVVLTTADVTAVADATYVNVGGDTMTGPLVLPGDPVAALQAAPRQYVDNAISLAGNYLGTWSVAANSPNISAGGSISNANYVAVTVNPATPEVVPVGVPGIAGMTVANGDRVIWASGLSTWQILRNAGVTLAAADARYYAITNPAGYQTAAQVQTAVAPALNNTGRNLLHNATFAVQQRGMGGWAVNGYTADRWLLGFSGGTAMAQILAAGDPDRAQIGDESATSVLRVTYTGGAGAGDAHQVMQRIEDVRRLAGVTVSVSFWARVSSGANKVGVSIAQIFGAGGSAAVTLLVGTATLTATWQQFSFQCALPSISGKTLGTAGTDFIQLAFNYSSGTTNAATLGVGVQSGVTDIWGVQLEVGSVATSLAKIPYADDLRNAQRFFYPGVWNIGGYQTAGQAVQTPFPLPVPMRATPAIATTTSASGNANAITTAVLTPHSVLFYFTAIGVGTAYGNGTFTASAEL